MTEVSNQNLQNMTAQQAANMGNILQAATRTAQESDLGRWLMSGARLLSSARTRLLEAERGYTAGRGKIIADAQAQLAELRTKTHEELRRFDIEHEAKLDALRRDVARLESMRDAGEWPA